LVLVGWGGCFLVTSCFFKLLCMADKVRLHDTFEENSSIFSSSCEL
jgi:hypothetical protein